MTRPSLLKRASVAVDLGAESCRVSLLQWEPTPRLRLVHRFPNGPVRDAQGTLRWPFTTILRGVEQGLRSAAALAPEGVASVAVDGWAVDYVRLEADGGVCEEPFCYRDARNVAAAAALHRRLPATRLRQITGVEQQPINTLYQLYADKLSGTVEKRWLHLPEFLLHRWGGEPVAEYTNASHTELTQSGCACWSEEIFRGAGLDMDCAPRIVRAGTVLGQLSGPLAAAASLANTALIAPACHDTASAIAGIAEEGDDWAYISCGTWSLVGTLVTEPLNGKEVRDENFTNLGAVGGKTLFHKGITGMWILKQCMDHWERTGQPWELPALLRAAAQQEPPVELLDVDDPALQGMGEMPGRINAQRRRKGHAPLRDDSAGAPRLVALVLHSLAARYAEVIERVRTHTGKDLRRVVMVGGGAQNALLRHLTSERTGLEVLLGPAESSTVGNLAVQCAVLAGVPAASEDFGRSVRQWAGRIGRLPLESA